VREITTQTTNVLVLGASGFFGPALIEALGASVLAKTFSSRAIAGGLRFDARSSSVSDLVFGLSPRPDAGIVALGETNIDRCARDPEGTSEINVKGVIRVIRELVALGIMPVFLSSDGVLDGARALASEDDEVRPILAYGRQKLEVERFIATLPAPWLIVRLPKLISTASDPRCMLTQWIDALRVGQRIVCATDQFFTPAATADAARTVAVLVRNRAHGLFHAGGPERLSRRALLQVVLDEYHKFAVPKAKITECSLRDLNVVESRPLDTSLSSKRLTDQYGPLLRPASEIARLAVKNRFSHTR
jgi:dTDP-4-dehydrorhamnose reductase